MEQSTTKTTTQQQQQQQTATVTSSSVNISAIKDWEYILFFLPGT